MGSETGSFIVNFFLPPFVICLQQKDRINQASSAWLSGIVYVDKKTNSWEGRYKSTLNHPYTNVSIFGTVFQKRQVDTVH